MPESNNIERANALLAESRFGEAKEIFSDIIKNDPSLSDAYLGRLLAELEMTSEESLKSTTADISEYEDFSKALAFADDVRKKELSEVYEAIAEKRKILSVYDSDFLENIYQRATSPSQTSESYSKNAGILRSIGGYRDSSLLAEKYEQIAAELSIKEAEEKRLRDIRENKEREAKRKKSDSVQIKIYSVAIAVLSVFLIFLICYNTFLKDMIKKQKLLDEIYPATYDELTVMDEDDAPWFYLSSEGVLSFNEEKYEGDGNIVIPDVFENTLVKSVKENAFRGFDKLKSVVISNYVEELGENTFYGCVSLERVVLPSSLSEIPAYCFYGCIALKEIEFPTGIESIDRGAFSECISLKELVFPNSLVYIGAFSFQNCSSINTIRLPASVSTIKTRAFSGCSAVELIIYSASESDFDEISIEVDNGPFDKGNEKVRFEFKGGK